MTSLQERVCKSRVNGIENAWILVSGSRRKTDDPYFCAKATISFLYDSGSWAAEWEPEYGPIQVWHKCDEKAENAKPHYFYEFTDNGPGNWSQMAVDNNELPQAFVNGEYKYIFGILEQWAKDR